MGVLKQMKYDEFYVKPNNELRNRRLREYRDFFIASFFPEDKKSRILDLGWGYGLFLDACCKSEYQNVFGVDFSYRHKPACYVAGMR